MNKLHIMLYLGMMGAATLFGQTGRDIMLQVENRPEPADEQSRLTMTLTDKRGRTRERELTLYNLDYEGLDYSIMQFSSPADVAGVAMLSMEQEDGETSQWLYMPALGRTRRIASSSKDDSFMGSDFSFEDLEARNVDKDRHELLNNENLNRRMCWKIRSVPVQESAYSQRISWIDQERLLPLKVEFYDSRGDLWKQLDTEDVQQIQGYWTPMKMTMTDLQKKQHTLLAWKEILLDQGLSPDLFTVGRIEGGF